MLVHCHYFFFSFCRYLYKTFCILERCFLVTNAFLKISYSLLIAVLEVGDGVFEVLSTSGDTHLGGDDFDKVRDLLASFPISWPV